MSRVEPAARAGHQLRRISSAREADPEALSGRTAAARVAILDAVALISRHVDVRPKRSARDGQASKKLLRRYYGRAPIEQGIAQARRP